MLCRLLRFAFPSRSWSDPPASKNAAQKQKSPRIQIFWHVGFGISLFTAVLGPQQPQARNVVFATATEVAATTHSLATHLHQTISVRGITRSVNIIAFHRFSKHRCIPSVCWMHAGRI